MKRNKYILFCFFLVLVLSSFSSCEKDEDFSVLPAETQSGNNTFGCYVEGKRFFGGYLVYAIVPGFAVSYHNKSNYIIINTTGKFEDNKKGAMHMQVFNPKAGVTLKLFNGEFDYINSNSRNNYGVIEGGEVTITKFDTINKIVSGRFSMIGKLDININDYSGNDSIRITEGRFDLKIRTISNN
jgi:hypothetical protein